MDKEGSIAELSKLVDGTVADGVHDGPGPPARMTIPEIEYGEVYTAAVAEFLEGVITHIQEFGVMRATTEDAAAIVTMAATALHRIITVRELITTNRLADAAVLVRSMLELEFSAVYIATAPPAERQHLGLRFFAFEEVQRERVATATRSLLTAITKDPTIGLAWDRALATVDRSEVKQAKTDFPNIEKSHYWCGLPIKRMLEKIPPGTASEMMLALYDTMYSALSDFAHANPVGVKHSVLPPTHYGILALMSVPLMAAMTAIGLAGLALEACGMPGSDRQLPEALPRFLAAMFGRPILDERALGELLAEAATRRSS